MGCPSSSATRSCPHCGGALPASRPVISLTANTIDFGNGPEKVLPTVAELIHILDAADGATVPYEAIGAGLWGQSLPFEFRKLLATHARHARSMMLKRTLLTIQTVAGCGLRLERRGA